MAKITLSLEDLETLNDMKYISLGCFSLLISLEELTLMSRDKHFANKKAKKIIIDKVKGLATIEF